MLKVLKNQKKGIIIFSKNEGVDFNEINQFSEDVLPCDRPHFFEVDLQGTAYRVVVISDTAIDEDEAFLIVEKVCVQEGLSFFLG